MRKVLIVNQGYQPIAAISWQRAMCLVFRDKAEVIDTYDDWAVSSPNMQFEVPAVLRLANYAKPPPSHAKFSRENVYLRDRHKCQYCGRTKHPRQLTFDHVLPKSKGGKTNWTNIVTACRPCNHKKADRILKDAGMRLITEPKMPNPIEIRRHVFTRGHEMPEQWKIWLQH